MPTLFQLAIQTCELLLATAITYTRKNDIIMPVGLLVDLGFTIVRSNSKGIGLIRKLNKDNIKKVAVFPTYSMWISSWHDTVTAYYYDDHSELIHYQDFDSIATFLEDTKLKYSPVLKQNEQTNVNKFSEPILFIEEF